MPRDRRMHRRVIQSRNNSGSAEADHCCGSAKPDRSLTEESRDVLRDVRRMGRDAQAVTSGDRCIRLARLSRPDVRDGLRIQRIARLRAIGQNAAADPDGQRRLPPYSDVGGNRVARTERDASPRLENAGLDSADGQARARIPEIAHAALTRSVIPSTVCSEPKPAPFAEAPLNATWSPEIQLVD